MVKNTPIGADLSKQLHTTVAALRGAAVVKSSAGRTTHSGGKSMMSVVSKRVEEVFTVPIVSPD